MPGSTAPTPTWSASTCPASRCWKLVSADGVRRGQDLEAIAIGMATGLASVHQAGLVHGNFGPEYVIMAPRRRPARGRVRHHAALRHGDAVRRYARLGADGGLRGLRPPASRPRRSGVLPDHLRGPVERCLDPEPPARPAARAVVLSLLGSQDLPAGVLAEGSRRAVRPARGDSDATGGPRPAGAAGSQQRHGAAAGPGRRASTGPSSPQGERSRRRAGRTTADARCPARGQAATRAGL